MGFRKAKPSWSYVEVLYLMENYHFLSIEQLCDSLLKSEEDIKKWAKDLGLEYGGTGRRPKRKSVRVCQNPKCWSPFIYKGPALQGELYCSNKCAQQMRKIKVPSKIELIDDYKDGLSTNDIAAKYKISKGTVYNLFKKHGIETRNLSEAITTFFNTEKGYSAIRNRLNTIQKKYGTTCLGNGGSAGFGNLKKGFKKDLGVSVRSGWEGNVLRWLTYKGIAWDYEPRTFFFEEIRKGTVAYMPDVYLPDEDIWLEIKGFLRPKDKTKIRRFKKYFPKEFSRLRGIPGGSNSDAAKFFTEMEIPIYCYYNDINKAYKNSIKNWE